MVGRERRPVVRSAPAPSLRHRLQLRRGRQRRRPLFKLVARAGADGNAAILPTPADPTGLGSFVAIERDGGSLVDSLRAGEWTGLGNPPGSKGWKYRNKAAPSGGAVAVLSINDRTVKLIARSTGGMPSPDAPNGDIQAFLQLGDELYCTVAQAPHANEVDDRLVKSSRQPPPAICSGACAFGPDVDGDGISDCQLPTAVFDHDLVDPARGREVGAQIVYPLGTVGPHPLVLVSHGGLGAANGEVLFAHIGQTLAAAGYVVVQVGHRTSATLAQHILDRPADVSFLIDAIESGTLALPADFGGMIDTTRVGHTGHSAGAYTSQAVAGASYPYGSFGDPRVAAIAPISPQGVGDFFQAFDNGGTDNTWNTVTQPVFVLLGGSELDDNGMGTFIETGWRLRPFQRYPDASDRFQVILTGQEHLDMGGQGPADVKAYIAQNVRAFFDHYLRGRGNACAIGTLVPPASGIDSLEHKPAAAGSSISVPSCPPAL